MAETSEPKRSGIGRAAVLAGSLALAQPAHGQAPHGPETPALGAIAGLRLRPADPGMETQRHIFEIALPDEMRDRLREVIIFAFEQGAAKSIDARDFNHCHVLVRPEVFRQYGSETYTGSLAALISGGIEHYEGLLCHTQEYADDRYIKYGLDPKKRNIVSMRGKDATLVEGPERTEKDTRYTVHASDLDLASFLTLHFEIDPSGDIELPDGKRLKTTVDVEHNFYKNANLQRGIPTADER